MIRDHGPGEWLMGKLLPFRGEETEESSEPQVLDIDDDASEEVFSALSSDTAREMLTRLYEEPATASDLAEAVDTSLQNTRYHLEKLESADLIEPVDTWYSSRGNEMTVYAPTSDPLVVAAGSEEDKNALRTLLERIVGGVVILALVGVVIDRLVTQPDNAPAGNGNGGGNGNGNGNGIAPTDAPMESSTPNGTTTPTPTEANGSGGNVTATDPPAPTETSTSLADTSVSSLDSAANATGLPVRASDGMDAVASLPPGAIVLGALLLAGLIIALGVAAIRWSQRRGDPAGRRRSRAGSRKATRRDRSRPRACRRRASRPSLPRTPRR